MWACAPTLRRGAHLPPPLAAVGPRASVLQSPGSGDIQETHEQRRVVEHAPLGVKMDIPCFRPGWGKSIPAPRSKCWYREADRQEEAGLTDAERVTVHVCCRILHAAHQNEGKPASIL